MKKLFSKIWPVFCIVSLWLIFASPYFLKGLVPFPSKYQVTFFPPWNASYAMPVKNSAMPDVITQIYPWKKLTIDTWKQGQVPLWNPYNFSGTVHAGNYQTAIFSPFNLLFFILPFVDAWSILVLLQPLLAGFFMYLYVVGSRSKYAALLASLAFMFCGFIVVWMAYGTLGYAVLWLPFIFWGISQSARKMLWRYLLAITTGIAVSFLSGHFQMSLYVLIAAVLYACLHAWRQKSWQLAFVYIVFILGGLLLASPQIFLSLDAFVKSLRNSNYGKGEVIPWVYLVTMIAPDFFGNPVTRNDWFGHYAEWAGFIGVIPLLLSAYAFTGKKKFEEWFFGSFAVFALLLAFPTPFNDFLYWAKIPVLATSAASRIIILASFALAVLSGYGLDTLVVDWHERKKRKTVIFVLVVLSTLSVIWALLLFEKLLPAEKLFVAKRNFVLPSILVFVTCIICLFGYVKHAVSKSLLIAAIILLTAFEMYRFAAKWMPFDPKEFVFPQTKTISFLEKNVGTARVFGNFGGELATYFHIPSLEGYDALYQKRYGEFISASGDGKIGQLQRSVVLMDRQGKYTEDMLELLGTRYILHRIGDGRNVWAFPFWNYPSYTQIYKDDVYEVEENTKAFPRAFLASSYIVETDKQRILDILFSPSYDRRNSLVLEEKLDSEPSIGSGSAVIVHYEPTIVDIEIKTAATKLLFLSDVYDEGWRAYVDGSPVKIYRADYDFRAIIVTAGTHRVEFRYK